MLKSGAELQAEIDHYILICGAATGGFTFATVRPTARIVMSWSDANAKYRWASFVAVSRTISASRRSLPFPAPSPVPVFLA